LLKIANGPGADGESGPPHRSRRDRSPGAPEGLLDHARQGPTRSSPRSVIQVADQVVGKRRRPSPWPAARGSSSSTCGVPLIARNLLDSIKLLAAASRAPWMRNASAGYRRTRRCWSGHAEATLATAHRAQYPHIGYDPRRGDRQGGTLIGAGRCVRWLARWVSATRSSIRRSTIARWRTRND